MSPLQGKKFSHWTEQTMSEGLTLEYVIAVHALWVDVPPGGQPRSCGCGHVFRLGESIARHLADAIVAAGLASKEPE